MKIAISNGSLINHRLLALGLIAITAACGANTGNDIDGGSIADGSVATQSDGGANAMDAGTATSDAAAGEKPKLDETIRVGEITIVNTSQVVAGKTYGSYTASAFFVENKVAASGGSGADCKERKVDACKVTVCPPTPAVATVPVAGASVKQQAGKIDIAGGAEAVALTPGTDATYKSITGQAPLWTAPVTLKVNAVGGVVPPFQASLTTPGSLASIKFAGKELGFATKSPLDRTKDAQLSWTGTGGGAASIQVYQLIKDMGAVFVACKTPLSKNEFTVPSAALSDFKVGEATVFIAAQEETEVKAGGFSIAIRATVSASDGAGIVTVQ